MGGDVYTKGKFFLPAIFFLQLLRSDLTSVVTSDDIPTQFLLVQPADGVWRVAYPRNTGNGVLNLSAFAMTRSKYVGSGTRVISGLDINACGCADAPPRPRRTLPPPPAAAYHGSAATRRPCVINRLCRPMQIH